MSYGSAYGSAPSDDPEYGDQAYDKEAEKDDEGSKPRASNFPWWCFPKARCFYHNIGKEIRDNNMRPTIYREYLLWYFSFIAYLTNLVAESYRYHYHGTSFPSSGVDLGISVGLLVLVWPATLFIYMLLYGAARDVGKSWTWWWLLMGLQMCVELFFAIGIPRTGAAGLVTMIQAFQHKQKAVGFACLATFLFFLTVFATHLADYIILWRYRSAVESGYTTQKNEKSGSGEDASIKEDKKKKEKKVKEKKVKEKKAPTPAPSEEENTYQPPEPTTATAASSSSDAPTWHKPVGSAYESAGNRDTTAKDTSTPKPTGGSSNPFGDEGDLDDFYS